MYYTLEKKYKEHQTVTACLHINIPLILTIYSWFMKSLQVVQAILQYSYTTVTCST